MLEPIVIHLVMKTSILILVSDEEFLSVEILDIGLHNQRVADTAPVTITWPKSAGNLAIASGIETT